MSSPKVAKGARLGPILIPNQTRLQMPNWRANHPKPRLISEPNPKVQSPKRKQRKRKTNGLRSGEESAQFAAQGRPFCLGPGGQSGSARAPCPCCWAAELLPLDSGQHKAASMKHQASSSRDERQTEWRAGSPKRRRRKGHQQDQRRAVVISKQVALLPGPALCTTMHCEHCTL